MTGTIRERSPGHFELRAYNAATGKQVTKTYVYPRNEKGVGIAEARKQLARLVTDIADGKFEAEVKPAEKPTLSAVLDEWIADGETRGRSPNTLHGYRSKATRIKTSPLGGVDVSKLTTRDLDRWYDDTAGRRDVPRHPDAPPSDSSCRAEPGEKVEVHPREPCQRCPAREQWSRRNAGTFGGASSGTDPTCGRYVFA